MSTRVLDLELGQVVDPVDVAPHREVFVVVRQRGQPIGTLWIDTPDMRLTPGALAAAMQADRDLMDRLARRVALGRLLPAGDAPDPSLTWSVAVCTRERPSMLQQALDSLTNLKGAPEQIVVVDNDPSSTRTREVADRFDVQYVVEPARGLNRARRRAAATATGDVLLLTDDDVVVEPDWALALVREFEQPRVGAATGLVLPLTLDTPAQREFERRGGFGRGFHRRVVDGTTFAPAGAGQLGAGASLAIRRQLVADLGLFDANIDSGTPARSGGDTYALYRILRSGHRVAYTPAAVAWHSHRETWADMEDTLIGYSTGTYAWMLHALADLGDLSVLKTGFRWFRDHHIDRLRQAVRGLDGAPPRELVLAEIRGALAAPAAFLATRRRRSGS